MTVEADGVFYSGVISITEAAPNKAILIMADKSVAVSTFSPIQIIGAMEAPDEQSRKQKKPKRPAKKHGFLLKLAKAWQKFRPVLFEKARKLLIRY